MEHSNFGSSRGNCGDNDGGGHVCDNRELARTAIGSVEACSCCGMASLKLGPISVRFTMGALDELHHLLTKSVIRQSIVHGRSELLSESVEAATVQA